MVASEVARSQTASLEGEAFDPRPESLAPAPPPRFTAMYITLFVDNLGARMVLVFVPFFALKLGAQPYQIGWINAAYYFLNAMGIMIWTPMTDFVSSRTILIFCITSLSFSYLLFAVADQFWMLVVARGWMGLFAGTTGICVAYVARHAPPESRGAAVSQTQAWLFIGGTVGPALASVLAPMGFDFVCFVSACLCMVNLVFVCVQVPTETFGRMERDDHEMGPLTTIRRAAVEQVSFMKTRMVEEPRLAVLYGLMLCNSLADGATISATIPLLLAYSYGYNATKLGYVFCFACAFVALYQWYVAKAMTKRLGNAASYQVGAFARVIAYLGVCHWITPWMPYAAVAISMASMTTASVVITLILAELTTKGQQGRAQSISQSFLALGIGLGCPIGGALFELRPELPFQAFALITMLNAVTFWLVFARPAPLDPMEESLLGRP